MACGKAPVARHTLLTGPPGIGKTTLVKNTCEALQKLGIAVQGFYTEEVRTGGHRGKRMGFDVVTLHGERGHLARIRDEPTQTTGKREYKVGQYSVEIHAFETTALPTLKLSVDQGGNLPVVVIDEIGKMELFSNSFKSAVTSVLNRKDTTVLATIPIPKGRPIPFIEDIRSRPDATVMTVSVGNRDYLLQEVLAAVKNSHGARKTCS